MEPLSERSTGPIPATTDSCERSCSRSRPRRTAREMRLEMEDWADGMLATLETNLDKFLVAVRRGRERLHERSQESVVAGIGPVDLSENGSEYS